MLMQLTWLTRSELKTVLDLLWAQLESLIGVCALNVIRFQKYLCFNHTYMQNFIEILEMLKKEPFRKYISIKLCE